MKLGFRNSLILGGILLILFSWYFGDWAVWLGAPAIFFGVIFKYVDRG